MLKASHVPRKSVMPTIDTIEEAMASCLQASPGTTTPQNEAAAATNPIVDNTQKMLATVVAAGRASEGNSYDLAGSQEPVLPPMVAIQISAPSATV